jgi:hypothetical protein
MTVHLAGGAMSSDRAFEAFGVGHLTAALNIVGGVGIVLRKFRPPTSRARSSLLRRVQD